VLKGMHVGRPEAKFLTIRKGDRTFLSRFQPLHLIKKASHDMGDLFSPFLGIILYIQSPRSSPPLLPDRRRCSRRDSLSLSLSLDEINRRYAETPLRAPRSRFCQGKKFRELLTQRAAPRVGKIGARLFQPSSCYLSVRRWTRRAGKRACNSDALRSS